MNDECQGSDRYSVLPSFPTKARTRPGNSHSHGSQCITGIMVQALTPRLSGSFLYKPLTLEPVTFLHCLQTSSLLQLVASQRARTSAFIRSRKQFHQSGWDGATADMSLDSSVVEQLCYCISCLCFQLNFLLLSSVFFKGQHIKMGQ